MPAANVRRDGMGKPVHFDVTHGNPGWTRYLLPLPAVLGRYRLPVRGMFFGTGS